MEIKIEITKTENRFLRTDEKIAEICIRNGNWKYWDNHMETDEKRSLTINNICKSVYLSNPVKDVYPFYDHEKAKETYELVVVDAMVRTYDSLLDYINCRVNNTKEEYKKYGWTERTYNIVFFELSTKKFRNDIVENISYEKDGVYEVKFTVVE